MLHQIQGMYIQIDHISTAKLLLDDPMAAYGAPINFDGTIELSLCGQEPIHIVIGDRDLTQTEFNTIIRLMGQI